MRKTTLAVAMTVLTLSLGTCAYLARTAGDAVHPAQSPGMGPLPDAAAATSGGQRVLTILLKPGEAPSGTIYESARVPEGWRAFPPTPSPSDPLVPALENLGDRAASEFAKDRRLSAATVRALGVFGVSIVAATDGTNPVYPEIGERDATIAPVPELGGLRIRHAQPAFLFLADGTNPIPADAAEFARTLRFGDANTFEYEDGLWGGSITVDTPQDADFLFPWTASGARVEVDGSAAAARAARVPLLIVRVPAGRHRVEVHFGEPATARSVVAIAAALGVVLSFVALWLGLRAQPEKDAGAAKAPGDAA
jgi:hypothetical protein